MIPCQNSDFPGEVRRHRRGRVIRAPFKLLQGVEKVEMFQNLEKHQRNTDTEFKKRKNCISKATGQSQKHRRENPK